MRSKLLLFLILLNNLLLAQKEVVEILGANELRPGRTNDHQKLVGNVILKFDDTKLFCDSAEVNGKTHDFNAWGQVFINQNNTTKAWGDSLIYDGLKKIGKLIGDVKMKSEKSLLKTNTLFFDKENNIVYYINGANTKQDESQIFSKKGFYNTKTKYLKLSDSVRIKNPEYTIKSDTLEYSTNSKTSYFLGPTNIQLKEEKVYCEAGFYNQTLEIGQFEQNAILQKDQQSLSADSIYFNKSKNISEAFYNVVLVDYKEHLKVSGEKSYFDRENNFSYITENVLFAQGSEDDTLYLVCDTLLLREDEQNKKSFFAYRNVKLFQAEMQGKCDSLAYNFSDSLIKLFDDPIIWNGESQLTGDSIDILNYDNKIQKLFIKNNGFIVSITDSTPNRFDQIKGRDLIGHFKKGKLNMIDVLGNGQTIYFAKEDDGKFTGVNKAICSNIKIKFNNGKIDRIKFLSMPEATFYPLFDFPESESILKGFNWRPEERPSSLKNLLMKSDL